MQKNERNPKRTAIVAISCWTGLFLIFIVIKAVSPKDDLKSEILTLLFYCLMIISMVLVVWRYEHKTGKEIFMSIGFRKPTILLIKESLKYGSIAIISLISLIIIEDCLKPIFLIPQLEEEVPANLEMLLITIFIQIIIVGIIEESFFRGYLFQRIEDTSDRTKAIILSSMLFGIFHFPKYVMFDLTNALEVVLYSFLAGMILCILFWKTESLYAPIGAHGLHNILQGYIVLLLRQVPL